MEMWLKRSTLMLFTVAVAGMVISAPIHVNLHETQGKVNIPFGSSLVLHCNLTKDFEKIRVSWYFYPSGSSFNASPLLLNKSTDPCEKTYNQTQQEILCILSNVNQEASGLYFCNVTTEIPRYMCINSSGVKINILKNLLENATYPSLVTSKQVPPPEDPWVINRWMWTALGVSTFILIVLLVILCMFLRRRCRRSTEPDPIYINTRPMVNKQPSPRPALPADKLKTASSSQNLQTPKFGKRYEESKRRQRQ